MEYVFGRYDFTGRETLQTKGTEHSNLSGFVEIVQEYPDCTITDTCFIVSKEKTDEDAENNRYDWYIIDRHNRTIDRTKPMKETMDTLIASILEG